MRMAKRGIARSDQMLHDCLAGQLSITRLQRGEDRPMLALAKGVAG
jgi:hypothetical protein